MRWQSVLVSLGFVAVLSGCAGMDLRTAKPLPKLQGATWAVLPFANNTETPMANDRAAALAAAILQSDDQRVVGDLPVHTRTQDLLGGNWKQEYASALSAARSNGAHYALAGSVDEWTYRAGINAEPEVAVTLWVVDVTNDKVIWSGVGSAHGGSLGRGGTGLVAQRLFQQLVGRALGR
jgi:TolB-like protein